MTPADSQYALLLTDFRNFVFYLWRHLNLPIPTDLQYDISLYLHHGPRRRMIQGFRGVAKSWITAAYVLWRLLKNPNERIMVVSASGDRADAFSIFVKRLIDEVELLHHLRPDPRKGHRDSNKAFDVGPSDPHQAPSVKSVGITGQLTGSRASIIIADDIEIPKNSLTITMREKLAESVKEFDAVVLPDVGEIIYLGTPQIEFSLYNSLPERGYDIRIWPARYPNKALASRMGSMLSPYLREKLEADPSLTEACGGRGAPTEPSRFHDLDLVEREASYGKAGFALQFMLDTSLSDEDRYPLKLSDLIVMGLDSSQGPVKVAWGSSPDLIRSDLPVVGLPGDKLYRPIFTHEKFEPYQGSVMWVDPSGRGKDETAYGVVKLLNTQLYLTAWGGYMDGFEDATLSGIARVAKSQDVGLIKVESNYGGGMFSQLLKPHLERIGHPCSVEDVPSTTQKERRIIDTLGPLLQQHRLVISEDLVRGDMKAPTQDYQGLYQLTRVTREKGCLRHDDRLEVLASACAHWVEVMGSSPDHVEREYRDRMLDEEIAKFMDVNMPGEPLRKRGNNWNNSVDPYNRR